MLGLARYEGDTEKIESAARERVRLLRPVCSKYPTEGTQLLNEVTQAKLCLTDDVTRGKYDDMLEAGSPSVSTEPDEPDSETYQLVIEEPVEPDAAIASQEQATSSLEENRVQGKNQSKRLMVACPQCRSTSSFSASMAGKRVKCEKCGCERQVAYFGPTSSKQEGSDAPDSSDLEESAEPVSSGNWRIVVVGALLGAGLTVWFAKTPGGYSEYNIAELLSDVLALLGVVAGGIIGFRRHAARDVVETLVVWVDSNGNVVRTGRITEEITFYDIFVASCYVGGGAFAGHLIMFVPGFLISWLIELPQNWWERGSLGVQSVLVAFFGGWLAYSWSGQRALWAEWLADQWSAEWARSTEQVRSREQSSRTIYRQFPPEKTLEKPTQNSVADGSQVHRRN